MREFGKVASSIWRSKKFRGLRDNDEARLLYLYFHTCQHGNSIGCFSFSIGYAMADLGWSEDKVDRAIKDLSIALLIDWNESEEVLRIVNFITKSPCTNEKHAKGAVSLALSLPDCEQKYRIINDLSQDKYASKVEEIQDFDRATIGLSEDSRTETLTETQTETLTETETARARDPHPPSLEKDEVVRNQIIETVKRIDFAKQDGNPTKDVDAWLKAGVGPSELADLADEVRLSGGKYRDFVDRVQDLIPKKAIVDDERRKRTEARLVVDSPAYHRISRDRRDELVRLGWLAQNGPRYSAGPKLSEVQA